jgi:type VI secretion system protein ImpC
VASVWESLTESLSAGEKNSLREALELALPSLPPDPRTSGRILLELDGLTAELDLTLGRQIDAILHHRDFQEAEKTWRSLKFLTDRTDSRENVEIYILDASKEDLGQDLAEAPEITRTSIFRVVYSLEYGQFGGQPYGALIGAYELGCLPEDLALMRGLSCLGAMAHAPFLVSAGAGFFGLDSWGELTAVQDLEAILSQNRYAAWQSMRTQENSRYLALILPAFLGRIPYSPQSGQWPGSNYSERADSDEVLVWGYSSVLLGLLLAQSFARYRWCANITGLDGGGLIEGLTGWAYESMGRVQSRIPLAARISEKLEQQLAGSGFIAVSLRDNPNQAAVYSAPTVLAPKTYAADRGGDEASFNFLVSTILPYMMIVNRLAHYIKVIQRENIGSWKDRGVIEKELNLWLNQYVTDMDSPSPDIRGKRPLRQARVEVTDLPDVPGWRQMALYIRPHLTFMGTSFMLSLVGRLDEVDFDLT